MIKKAFYLALAGLIVLHHDAWLWHDGSLVLGFLPAGLAYHAGFSLATAGLWALAVRYVWPEGLGDDPPPGNVDRRGSQ